MNQLKSFFRFLRFHKWKISLFFGLTFLFLFFMFPFSDLNDLISVQVSRATQGQVFVQFDNIQLSLFPDTGLSLEKLSVETPDFGPLGVDHLIFLPSIRGLIAQEPSGILKMRGVLRGTLDLSITPGKKTESGLKTHAVNLEGKSLALGELKKVIQLPVTFSGKMDLSTHGSAETTFNEQPDFDLEMKIDKFEMPAATIDNPQTGPISWPALKISKIELRGRLSAGRFNIEKAVIGGPGDEVSGNIKGGVSLTVQNRGTVMAIPGSYNLEVDLNIAPAFEQKFSYLQLLDSYKTPAANGMNRFAFKISATAPELPPTMGPIR